MEPFFRDCVWRSFLNERFKRSHLLLISGLESLRVVNDDARMLVALKPLIDVVFSSRPLIFLWLEKKFSIKKDSRKYVYLPLLGQRHGWVKSISQLLYFRKSRCDSCTFSFRIPSSLSTDLGLLASCRRAGILEDCVSSVLGLFQFQVLGMFPEWSTRRDVRLFRLDLIMLSVNCI